VVGYFRAPTTARRISLGALALIAALIGAGSRGDSALYVAFGAVLAAFISFERSRRYLLSLLVPVAAVVMAAVFYLGSNQVGAALGGGMTDQRPQHVDIVGGLIRAVVDIPRMWAGNFGTQALGWGDTVMPSTVWFTTLALYAGVAFWTLSRRRDTRVLIAAALTAVALVMIPSWVIVQNGIDAGANVQPRYILPLQILLLGLLLFGVEDPRTALTRVQRWIVALGLVGANAISLHVTMRRYLTGTDHSSMNLDEGVVWWWHGVPLSPNAVWFLGAAAFAAVAVIVAGLVPRAGKDVRTAPAAPAEPERSTAR